MANRHVKIFSTSLIIQFSSVAQLCPTLRDPMNCITPGLLVHHQLPEFTQTHVHWVGDAIQPSHPLSSPSPPAPNPSQHQGFFQWVNSSHEVAEVLEFQLQHQSFQWTPRTDSLLGWTGWISLLSKGLSRVFSNTTVQEHQLIIRGMQIKTTISQYHLTPVKMAIIKKNPKTINAGESVEGRESSYTIGGLQLLWRTVWRFLKKQICHMTQQSPSWAYIHRKL